MTDRRTFLQNTTFSGAQDYFTLLVRSFSFYGNVAPPATPAFPEVPYNWAVTADVESWMRSVIPTNARGSGCPAGTFAGF